MREINRAVREVAEAMRDMLEARGPDGRITQREVLQLVLARPDSAALTRSRRDNQNHAPAREIYDAFHELTDEQAIWAKRHRYWRWRRDSDPEGGAVDE